MSDNELGDIIEKLDRLHTTLSGKEVLPLSKHRDLVLSLKEISFIVQESLDELSNTPVVSPTLVILEKPLIKGQDVS